MEIDPKATAILNAWLCECLDVDSIIGSLVERTNDLREELGNLNEAQAPVALVIYDVLTAMHLPAGAIRLVLGNEMDVIDDRTGNDVPCYFCGAAAVGVKESLAGGWNMVCKDHAKGDEE